MGSLEQTDNHATAETRAVGGNTAAVAAALAPAILDAVRDQHSRYWICYGTPSRSTWFSLDELQRAEAEVFSRLSGPGMTFLTAPSKNAFKRQIEAHADYREGLVAGHSGWLGNLYVFGDGWISAPPGDEGEVIVAFEPDPKFKPVGTLKGWQDDLGPLVTDQSLLLFVVSFASIPPLLRFAPAHITNPLVELVGARETGKSTAGALAASVWAGDPSSDAGGAETWDMTLNSVDDQKRRHADCHLGLDEGNLAESADLIEKAIFKLAGTGQKRRHGNIGPLDQVRLSMLSTTNVPLADLLSGRNAAVRGALQSRMITVQVGGAHGVFTSVPDGFAGARAAVEALRVAADKNYGVAGDHFVARLAKLLPGREQELRAFIERNLNRYIARRRAEGVSGSARVGKTFALAYVAGLLMRNMGVIRKEWGNLDEAIAEVHRAVEMGGNSPRMTALGRVSNYAKQHEADLIEVESLERPLTSKEFEGVPGFIRQRLKRRQLLVSTARFQQEFPNYRSLLKELRDIGLAQTEAGEQAKLSIKAPAAVCDSGRVYCIYLDDGVR